MTDDNDLRSRLERIASFAGDPPEHGLDRVAARRHRRLRRRRGAVAAAAVLAVLAVAVPLIRHSGSEDRASVAASGSARSPGASAEVPREIVVRCEPTGIVVPVASVRPQRDGLHIRVVNALRVATVLEVDSERWSSGEITVPPGEHQVRQPVPPGEVTIGCEIAGETERRRIDLVDPADYWVEPELECEDGDEVVELEQLPVDPPTRNIITAARTALDSHLVDGTADDAIGALRGYPSQRLADATADPTVQVSRAGRVVAFASVRGADGAAEAPWLTVDAQVCGSLLAGSEPDDTTTSTPTTSTTEPGGRPDPT